MELFGITPSRPHLRGCNEDGSGFSIYNARPLTPDAGEPPRL